MSAWIVDHTQIDLLLDVALNGPRDSAGHWDALRWRSPSEDDPDVAPWTQLTADDLTRVGRMLVGTNVDSVMFRYQDEQASEMLPDYVLHGYSYRQLPYRMTAAEALKSVGCLQYQSCEHEEWKTSEAYDFLQNLTGALISHVVGYNESPWGWEDADLETRGFAVAAPGVDAQQTVRFLYNGSWREVRPLKMRETQTGVVLVALEISKDGERHLEPLMRSYSPLKITELSGPLVVA
jgi:hypothetical protein